MSFRTSHRMVTLALLAIASTAAAHTPRPFSGSDGQVMWDLVTPGYPADNVIPYVINPTRPAGAEILPAGTTEEDLVAAIRNVFQAYENVPTSRLRFRYLGADPTATFAVDGVILVTLDFTDPGVVCTRTNFKKLQLAPASTEYTFPDTGETVAIERPFTVVDYDIAICDGDFSLDGTPGTIDLAGLLAHELGHMFGLGHSIIQPCTMSGYRNSMAGTNPTLSHDERQGISVLYPAEGFFESTGTLDGVVVERDADGTPVGEVFGAHLTVVDAVTGEAVTESVTGVSAVDPVTGRAVAWDRDKTSGRFVISGLTPGEYLLRVDAYDGPTPVGSTGKIINMGFFDGDALGPRRDFGYLMDPTVRTATAGAVTDVGELTVAPFEPGFPNVDAQLEAWDGVDWRQPAVVIAGETTQLRIPKGVDAGLDDEFFVDGNDGVVLAGAAWDEMGECILVDAIVAADSPLGAQNLIVRNATGFSMIHGGLLVASGRPEVESVLPRCAVAGAAIEIRGRHFNYDTHVHFDGLLASDIVVVSPTLITATATADIARPVTVTLLSDTGTHELVLTLGADLDGDGAVGLPELLRILSAWGTCDECAEDLDDDGVVGFADLMLVLSAWGSCP
jgi:hypothetical protein